MSQKPAILVMSSLMPSIEAKLEASFELHRLPPPGERDVFLRETGPRIRGVATSGSAGLSRGVMEALPALEIVAVNGIGVDAVDTEQAKRRGIPVTATPGVLTEDVADLGMALMLAVSRNLCNADRFVREGRWERESMALGHKVSGKHLGILGMGRIGRAMAQRAAGFGMTIAYNDLHPVEGLPDCRFVPSLVELARESDFLVITASGGPESRGLVNAHVLDALGPEGILINIARGSIVSEPALIAALQERRLGGAGLDVFSDEPHVPEALRRMENVVLQPHRASATVETRLAMGNLVVENLRAHFAGQPLPTRVA